MNRKFFAATLLATGALISQTAAQANPYVFQVTSTYDVNTNPTIFGSAVTVSFTVDNGNASTANQTYSWNDITGVSAQAVGGSYFYSWANFHGGTTGADFLTTGAAGQIASLNWGPSGPLELINSAPDSTFGQIGSGFYTTIDLAVNDNQDMAYVFRDMGPAANPVLEPETYALMLAGLGLLGFAARRRRAAVA